MSCGNPHEVDCVEILQRVYDYLDGEMDVADVGKVRQHLDECSPCLRQYDLEVALKALVRRSCQCEPAPEELRLRIMHQISQVRLQLRG